MTAKSKRRSLAIGLFLVFALAAGGAYAYWTSTGGGTGTASTANPAANQLTVTNVTPVTNLSPGSGTQNIVGDINNTGSNAITVTNISVSFAGTTWQPGCGASDYQINGSPLSTTTSVPAGGTVPIPAGLSVEMLNTASNQDGCKGQALTITITL